MAKTVTKTKAKAKATTKTTTKKPKDLTKRLHAVIKQEAETWVEFAQVAYEIYNTEHWRKKGFSNLKEYVAKETDGKVSYEIFMHRVKMGEVVRKYKLKKEQIINLGWTKFKEIATLALSDENMSAKELLDFIKEAKDLSFRDLQAFVRQQRIKKLNGEEQKIVTIKFRLLDEQDNVVKEALDAAMSLSETDNPSIGLTYMATEFLIHHSEDSSVVQAVRERVNEISKEVVKAPHKPHSNKGRKKNGKKEETLDEILEN